MLLEDSEKLEEILSNITEDIYCSGSVAVAISMLPSFNIIPPFTGNSEYYIIGDYNNIQIYVLRNLSYDNLSLISQYGEILNLEDHGFTLNKLT